MEFSIKSGNPEKQRTGCVVVAITEPRRLSPSAKALDNVSKKALSNVIRRGDMDGKTGQSLLLHNVPGTLADRVKVWDAFSWVRVSINIFDGWQEKIQMTDAEEG